MTGNAGSRRSDASCATGGCPLISGRGLVLWAILLCGVLLVQSSLLRGWGYKSGGTVVEGGITWQTSYSAALAESQATGKPVLIDFTASWCPPCQMMKRDVWPDPQVAQLVSNSYMPLLADVDEADIQDVARRYGVNPIPTVIITDGQGAVLRQEGFLTRDGMLEFLRPR
jgi:thiol:disulfide interchange protein